jgi:hypothetical protein
MLSEAVLAAIAEGVVRYALEQSGLGEQIRSTLGRNPVKRAFAEALGEACRAIEGSDPTLAGKLFDKGFLRHEATPVLAQLLWRHGRPTGAQLAGAWADSLDLRGETRDKALSEMTPAADDFFALLEDAAKKQPDLQEVFDRRSAEQTADNTSALPDILDVLRAGLPLAAEGRTRAPTPTRIPAPKSARFVGRSADLKWLYEQLRAHGRAAIVGVRGIGGIGKTELAIAVAQRLRSQYRGRIEWFDCGPNDVFAIQDHMAAALGIALPEAGLAVRADALHQAWRARPPTLVVLDDLRPRHLSSYAHLAPPCPPCSLLITSRRGDLPLHNEYAIRELDPLARDESHELLAVSLPPDWVATEPEAAAAIAELLEHIPLALMLAARRAREIAKRRKKPSRGSGAGPGAMPLAALHAEIKARHIEVLDQGSDPDRPDLSIVVTFDISYEELEAEDQARLRRIGVFARDELASSALQAVWGDDEKAARRALRRLANAGLIQETDETDTWWMHDLLREYAGRRLESAGTGEATAARLAHAGYWQHWLDALDPYSVEGWKQLRRQRFDVERTATWLLDDWEQAPRQAAELAVAISQVCQPYAWPRWDEWMRAGMAAAEAGGHRNAARRLQLGLAKYHVRRGEMIAAEQLLQASLTAARELLAATTTRLAREASQQDVAATLRDIARLKARGGDGAGALALHRERLGIFEELGDVRAQAMTLGNIVRLKAQGGDAVGALALHQEMLDIIGKLSDVRAQAVALDNIARLQAQDGDVAGSLALRQQELAIYKRLGDVRAQAVTLGDIARLTAQDGDVAGALGLHQERLKIFERLDDVRERAVTLGDIARLQAQGGDFTGALGLHQERLDIFERWTTSVSAP